MSADQILEIIAKYRSTFEYCGIEKIDLSLKQNFSHRILKLGSCHSMLDQTEELVREGRMEEAVCQIGFIQGVLWCKGIYTLNELKSHCVQGEVDSCLPQNIVV